jgi:4-diphosphocytidyl-2-C-methyl-D-erythritol kinase
MGFLRLLAPAKINLHLRVGSADSSGYHPLVSWMCTVGFFDTLTMRQVEGRGIRLSCDHPDLPCDDANLVVRAARMLWLEASESDAVLCPGVEVTLQKRLPMGGGLGGGSSDAAKALVGLNLLWKLNLPLERLHEVAARLGSDVPFFLHGGSSVCTGRGDIVQPTPGPVRAKWALLILSPLPLSTVQVYRRFDELRLGEAGFDAQPVWQEWADLSAGPLLSRLRNDLERPAFACSAPLGRLREALEATLGRVIRMTGSGSTLFTLYDRRDEAESAAGVVRARHSLDAVVAEIHPRVMDGLSSE